MRRFVIKETCVVGRVRVPLLAAGKLLKQGWQLVRKEQPETPSTGEEAPARTRGFQAQLADCARRGACYHRGAPEFAPESPQSDLDGRDGSAGGQRGHALTGWWRQDALRRDRPPGPQAVAAIYKARTTLFRTVAGWWLQVENSADYINEANPFTMATKVPKAWSAWTPLRRVSFQRAAWHPSRASWYLESTRSHDRCQHQADGPSRRTRRTPRRTSRRTRRTPKRTSRRTCRTPRRASRRTWAGWP